MERICLGKITKAHGIRGAVKLDIYTDNAHLLEELSPLYTAETGEETVTVTLKSEGPKGWLAQIKGINDRTEAEALQGTELWVNRNALPAPATDTFYVSDLIGLVAVDKSGHSAGKVIAIHDFGAGDLLEIQPENGKSFLISFTRETVPDLDLESGRITVVRMEEM